MSQKNIFRVDNGASYILQDLCGEIYAQEKTLSDLATTILTMQKEGFRYPIVTGMYVTKQQQKQHYPKSLNKSEHTEFWNAYNK